MNFEILTIPRANLEFLDFSFPAVRSLPIGHPGFVILPLGIRIAFLELNGKRLFFCSMKRWAIIVYCIISSRMAACNAHNQELQRKVSQLEKCNMWEAYFLFFSIFNCSSLCNQTADISSTQKTLFLALVLPQTPVNPIILSHVFIHIFFLSLFSSLPLLPHPLCRSLMEQLRRLQALVMNTSKKPAQTGTCVLVWTPSVCMPGW